MCKLEKFILILNSLLWKHNTRIKLWLDCKEFPGGSDCKASTYSAGDPGSIPRLRRSPGEGNGNPFQYSCLETPMDGGAWWATVHGVTKSWTQMSDFTSLWPYKIITKWLFLKSTNFGKQVSQPLGAIRKVLITFIYLGLSRFICVVSHLWYP